MASAESGCGTLKDFARKTVIEFLKLCVQGKSTHTTKSKFVKSRYTFDVLPVVAVTQGLTGDDTLSFIAKVDLVDF